MRSVERPRIVVTLSSPDRAANPDVARLKNARYLESVARAGGEPVPLDESVATGARDAAHTLGWDVPLSETDVESYDEYVGEDYGVPSPEALSAIKLAARTEGLLLDPVYTGKAMAGLIDHARRGLLGPDSVVVFIHTGGLPALFAFKDEILASLDG